MPSKYLVQQIIKEYLEDSREINGVLDNYVTKLQQRIKQCQVLIPGAWTTGKHQYNYSSILCRSLYAIWRGDNSGGETIGKH